MWRGDEGLVSGKALCPVCKSPTRAKFDDVYDDRFGYAGKFSLQQCMSCGHLHLAVDFNPRQLHRLFTQFSPRSACSLEDFAPYEEANGLKAWWNGERSAAFRWVPRDVSVLEVGCGFGQALAYHKARGCDVHGCELDENIRSVAERFGLKVHVGAFDANLYESEYFDYVTLDQGVESSSDPVGMLAGIARVLKSGGTAILSTPNPEGILARLCGSSWMNWHAPYRQQFFTRQSMSIAAKAAGLHLCAARTITSSQWVSFQWWHLLSRPQLGSPSPFWIGSHTSPFLLRKPRKHVSLHQRLGLNNLVARVLDAFGIGDNCVYVLRKGEA